MRAPCIVVAALSLLLFYRAPAAGGEPDAPPADLVPSRALLVDVLKGNERARHMPGAERPHTRIERWTLSDYGLDGTREMLSSDDGFREDISLGPFTTAAGRLHGVRWSQNENGLVRRESGAHRRDEVSRAALAAASSGSHYVRVIGEVATPKPAFVVEVDPPGGRHEYLFFDKDTLLMTRMEAASVDRRVVTTYDDFRTTRGLTEPWHVHSSDGLEFNDVDEKLNSIDFDRPVDENRLVIPTDRRRVVEFPAPSVSLGARIVEDRVIVPIKIAGRTIDLQLDSGAAGILIDRSVLDALHLKSFGRGTGTTAGTYVETRSVVPDLALGSVHMRDVVVSSIPFAQSVGEKAPIAGLLGFDFIEGVVVHIDYMHGTVEITDPASFSPPPGARSAEIALDDGVPFVAVGVGDAVGRHFILDTGADRSMLFSAFAKQYPREVADQGLGQAITASFPFVIETAGVGGDVKARPLQVRSMTVAGFALARWLFLVTEDARSFEGEDLDGLIGQDFLRNFDVYLDYPHARIWFQPNDRFRARYAST
jgi:hypothetical protein